MTGCAESYTQFAPLAAQGNAAGDPHNWGFLHLNLLVKPLTLPWPDRVHTLLLSFPRQQLLPFIESMTHPLSSMSRAITFLRTSNPLSPWDQWSWGLGPVTSIDSFQSPRSVASVFTWPHGFSFKFAKIKYFNCNQCDHMWVGLQACQEKRSKW
jgi:hypothetical protein